jgi:hypothetical protein
MSAANGNAWAKSGLRPSLAYPTVANPASQYSSAPENPFGKETANGRPLQCAQSIAQPTRISFHHPAIGQHGAQEIGGPSTTNQHRLEPG